MMAAVKFANKKGWRQPGHLFVRGFTVMDFDLSSILRMVAAIAAGGAIGLNRDVHGKPTGIRAHALVSLGAALLVIAGRAHIGAEDPAATSRVIQGIIA